LGWGRRVGKFAPPPPPSSYEKKRIIRRTLNKLAYEVSRENPTLHSTLSG
jgi:hypothetical protein